MNQDTASLGLYERNIPIKKSVVDLFVKEPTIGFAKGDNDAVYISNGHFILKTNQSDYDKLIAQINRRRRTSYIEDVERPRIMDYVRKAKGNFELSQEPHEKEMHKKQTQYLYADNKQYFSYDKKYVDILSNSLNRLFVDDNTGYDNYAHSMIVKNRNNDVLGIVLPISVPDELYPKLADVLPLEIGWKSEIERIKYNPTNDPFIGKEFYNGKQTFIISALRNYDGVDKYVISKIENGKLMRGGDLATVDELKNQITRWQAVKTKKPGIKEQVADGAKKAEKHNAALPTTAKSKKEQNAEI